MALAPVKGSAAAPPQDGQKLPARELGLFQQAVKFYETKQHKKGLKSCDSILASFPNHGETLAMKGLLLMASQEKAPGGKVDEEVHKLVKRGLTLNVRSFVCWHVYGLVYRAERKFEDAIKCFQNALKFDANNQQVLKDISVLQIQQRDLEGYLATKRNMLAAKPSNRGNWVAFAVAAHLAGQPALAVSTIESFQSTLGEERTRNDYENSELRLYKNLLLQELGRWEEALADALAMEEQVRDTLSLLEYKAKILLQLGRRDQARDCYRQLLAINSEHHAYHAGLRQAMGLDPPAGADGRHSAEQMEGLRKLFASLSKEFPKSAAARRLALDFARGDEFEAAARDYIKRALNAAVPSLFTDLKPLYADADRAAALARIIEGFAAELAAAQRFAANEAPRSANVQAPLWALYLLAQHLDHVLDLERALQAADRAIAHTPTFIDAFVIKAQIYKHAGDAERAFQCMDRARQMDLQDRYLNVECVQCAHLSGRGDDAMRIVKLFLRDGERMMSLYDLQVMWFEVSAAEMHMRKQEFGLALKLLHHVQAHLDDIVEDQADFHAYSIRKGPLRAYVEMIRFIDSAPSFRHLVTASKRLVQIYMQLHDRARAEEAAAKDEAKSQSELDNLSTEERKRVEKARKRKARREQERAAAAAAVPDAERKAREEERARLLNKGGKVDDDMAGERLAKTDKPLEEATRFLRQLQTHSRRDLETHTLGVDLYTRKGKLLLALRALREGHALAPTHPSLVPAAVTFLQAVAAQQAAAHPVVREVLAAEMADAALFGGRLPAGAEAFVAQLESAPLPSFAHRVALASALLSLRPRPKDARERFCALVGGGGAPARHELEAAQEAMRMAQDEELEVDAGWLATLRERLHRAFPLTPRFMTEEQSKARELEEEKENQREAAKAPAESV